MKMSYYWIFTSALAVYFQVKRPRFQLFRQGASSFSRRRIKSERRNLREVPSQSLPLILPASLFQMAEFLHMYGNVTGGMCAPLNGNANVILAKLKQEDFWVRLALVSGEEASERHHGSA